jgi:hypothetical protein
MIKYNFTSKTFVIMFEFMTENERQECLLQFFPKSFGM